MWFLKFTIWNSLTVIACAVSHIQTSGSSENDGKVKPKSNANKTMWKLQTQKNRVNATLLLTAWKVFEDESKVLQYFRNVRHKLVTPDAFAKIMKGTKFTGLWETKLTWYSPNATHRFCHYGLEYRLGIYFFRSTWSSTLVKVLATIWWSTVVNCVFAFHTKLFIGASKALWLRLNRIRLRCSFVCMVFKSHSQNEEMHNVSANQLPRHYQSERVSFLAWTAQPTSMYQKFLTALGLPDIVWSSRFLQPNQNFSDYHGCVPTTSWQRNQHVNSDQLLSKGRMWHKVNS